MKKLYRRYVNDHPSVLSAVTEARWVTKSNVAWGPMKAWAGDSKSLCTCSDLVPVSVIHPLGALHTCHLPPACVCNQCGTKDWATWKKNNHKAVQEKHTQSGKHSMIMILVGSLFWSIFQTYRVQFYPILIFIAVFGVFWSPGRHYSSFLDDTWVTKWNNRKPSLHKHRGNIGRSLYFSQPRYCPNYEIIAKLILQTSLDTLSGSVTQKRFPCELSRCFEERHTCLNPPLTLLIIFADRYV